jgi:hypothetical protein
MSYDIDLIDSKTNELVKNSKMFFIQNNFVKIAENKSETVKVEKHIDSKQGIHWLYGKTSTSGEIIFTEIDILKQEHKIENKHNKFEKIFRQGVVKNG